MPRARFGRFDPSSILRLIRRRARGGARSASGASSYFKIPQANTAHRSISTTAAFAALCGLFIGLMFVPAVTSVLRIDRTTGVAGAGLVLACSVLATAAYRSTGLSWLYLGIDVIESLVVQLFVCLLIYRSGSAISFLWLAYIGHVLMCASLGTSRRNLAVIAAGPAALVLAFSLDRATASALLSLLPGVMGIGVYTAMAGVYSDLEDTRAREAQLRFSLARVHVAEERSRIARDLHDGVAGSLAALSWRLRRLSLDASAAPPGAFEMELRQAEQRIRGALEDLRHVVLDLRQEQRSWKETLVEVRERCEDLCGGRDLVFEVDGTPEGDVEPRLADDLQRIIVELVRNATAHANPRRVEVQLRIRNDVDLSVSDDGSGLRSADGSRSSGGLANIRTRVDQLGGKIHIRPAEAGTRIEVRLPAVGTAA